MLPRRRPAPAGSTAADISGTIADSQLAIGQHIIQNNIAAGAIIHQIDREAARTPRARPLPVRVLPRQAPALFGRDAELGRATRALGADQPVQFCAPSGHGKTALLRHLAHALSSSLPDGVIYYRSRGESVDDLLQRVFEFLYECDGARVKPTPAELTILLGQTRALFLLDDVDLDREDLEALMLQVPRSTFVFGSHERTLWSDGDAIALRGLVEADALRLVEHCLGRPLAGAERADFGALCRALGGQPLQIIKAATEVREAGTPAAALLAATAAGPAGPADATGAPAPMTARIAAELTPDERQVLALLVALGGAPLHVGHLAKLTGRPDAAALLASLEARGLTQSHSPRYSATAPLGALAGVPQVQDAGARLRAYFITFAESHVKDPAALVDDLEPMIAIMQSAMGVGAVADVLRLARATDGAAAFTGRWDAWRTIVQLGLEAARALGDPAQEAWALHQLGSRALCLGDTQEASDRLGEALRIRERIGDEAGAAATRNNLGQLPGAPPPASSDGPPWSPPPFLAAGFVVAAGLVMAVGAIVAAGGPPAGAADAGVRFISATQPTVPRPAQRPPGRLPPNDGGRAGGTGDDGTRGGDGGARFVVDRVPDPDAPDGVRPGDPRPLPSPVPPSPPPPAPPPPPPPAPAPVLIEGADDGAPVPFIAPCGLDLVGLVARLIHGEVDVVTKKLAQGLDIAVEAEIALIRELLAGLGHDCSAAETAQLLAAAGG